MGLSEYEKFLSSLEWRAAWAKGCLVIYMIICSLHFLSGCYLLSIELRTGFGYPYAFVTSFGALICSLAFLITAFPVALWLYRARANLLEFQLEELRYTPAATVGSLFIPIVNFIIPFRSMRELYNRSAGESQYQAMETVSDVSSWWTAFIVGILITAYLLLVALIDALTNFVVTVPAGANTALGLFSTFLLGVSAFFLFRVVKSITVAQRSLTGVAQIFA